MPTIPEVIDDFRAYHGKPENGSWGSLHIVMADENVSEGDVRFCLEQAERAGDDDGVRLARVLLSLSRSQRMRLARTLH